MGEKPTAVDEQAEMPPEASGQDERTGHTIKMNASDRTLDKSSPQLRSAGPIKIPPELAEDIPIKREGGGSPAEKAAGGEKGDSESQRAIRNFNKSVGS